MPSDPSVPVGTMRHHAPTMRNQDTLSNPAASGGTMQPGYPVAEYIVQDTSALLPVTRGARTLLPLATGTPTSGRAFSEYATPRLDAANSRIRPTAASEILHVRFSCKIVRDPNASPTLLTLLGGLVTAVSGIAGVDYLFNAPQAAIVEADGSSTYGPFFAETASLVTLPQVVSMEFMASGQTAFVTNGARFFLTVTAMGLAVTDVRAFLVQAR